MRSRNNLALRDRSQIIDLQVSSSAWAAAVKVTGKCDPYSGIGKSGSDAAMQYAGTVSKFIARAALNCYPVGVTPHHTHANQFIERHVLRYTSKLANGQVAHCIIEECS